MEVLETYDGAPAELYVKLLDEFSSFISREEYSRFRAQCYYAYDKGLADMHDLPETL